MLHFDSIIDFIDVLYKEKKILEFLFEKRRKEVMSDQILSLIDYNEDRLNALLLQKVLIERVNSIELNHDLNGFFEKTLQITEEINNEYTSGLLKNLATKMELVRASKKLDDRNNYIRETVNTLDKIGQNLLQNINQIRINIEDVYSTATNNAVRKIKLKDYDEKTKEIDILIDEVYSLLKSNRWESFLKIAENDDLWNATILLQKNAD